MKAFARKDVLAKFKIKGYTLNTGALEGILSYLNHFPEDAKNEGMDLLLEELKSKSLKSSTIDKELVDHIVSNLEAIAADKEIEKSDITVCGRSPITIIDVFLVPKICYDPMNKQFYELKDKFPIYGDSSAKASLYKDRYLLLAQRLTRDKHFSKPAFGTGTSHFGSCEISSIQSLVGWATRKWVMGVISQLEDGHFYLEDLTASVKVNLSNAKTTTGFFVENTIVVAEGEMNPEGIFQVKTCGFPPLEERDESIKLLAGLDYFGGGTATIEETLRLGSLEKNAVNDMFVVLSDLWLDDNETMQKLCTVLDGYENVEVTPTLFVFMGNFCSRSFNIAFNSMPALKSQFGKLGKIIRDHRRLMERSRFLFIPGPNDVGPSTALPRCALPNYLTEELRNHVPNAEFLTNPCRVKFYTQEIVFFRQDLLYKMQKSCLLTPTDEETSDPFEHLVATLTHQSHMCPLPLHVQPIIWNYDYCLRLYPTPHTLVLGDKSEQKAFKYAGITCFNPGSFSNDSTFVAYRPCNNAVELSSL